jgi:hypothetical protein
MSPRLLDVLGSFSKVDVVPTVERNLDRLEIRYKWADSKAAKIALQAGKGEREVLGIKPPGKEGIIWIRVNATPQFKSAEDSSCQVDTTFEDITATYN